MKISYKHVTAFCWPKGISIILYSVIIVALICERTVIADQIYRCIDASGNETFTNQLQQGDCHPLLINDNSPIGTGTAKPDSILARELMQPPDKNVSLPRSVSMDTTAINGTGLNKFYDKLRKLQKGELTQVTIFHVGDSHVRSESYSSTVAARLQRIFGAHGGTFCFPSVKKHSSSKGHKKSRVMASKKQRKNFAKRSRSINIPPNQAYSRMSRNLSGGREPLTFRTVAYRQPVSEQNDRLVKNTTTVVPTSNESETCSSISAVPDSPNGSGISYFSYGNSGKTFSWFSLQPSLISHLQRYRPDFVIVTLGTNDAFAKLSYEAAWKDIDSFVAVIRSVSPDSSILFTTPPDSYFRNGTNNPYIAIMQKVIVDYATSNGLAAWDFYSAMGGEGSMNRWLNSGLAKPDRIHLTTKGYTLKGDMLSTALLNGYNRYLKE